ncbi:Opt2 protein [Saccharomycopsis crataegensis]|uniref:Opt2 protein n=1 Tax=Saccharomycopsis crataegensis TaxID=43959 RepID=A0AAV5QT67_9ASCO|nr:Opt2 protein [Saccharomycopsis crataegensis]
MSSENYNEKTVGEKDYNLTSQGSENATKEEYSQLDESYRHQLYVKLGHAHLEDDSAIPEIEYLFQKIEEMSVSQAIALLKESLIEHDDDPNFPLEDYATIESLVQGSDANPEISEEEWTFQVKMFASLKEYFSPYPEVRAISSPLDDPEMPCETIRAYFLGFIWTAISTFLNEFFSHRQPSITLTASVCQIFLYPCGKVLELILPDWGFTMFGSRHSLNPGPWNYKEQMFATIIFDVAIGGVYVSSNIYVQKLDVYYGSKWVSVGYQVFLALSTQFLGFGLAGILREIVVYPSRAVWPSLLPTLALNQALLRPERKEIISGWKISRYNFFFIFFVFSFVYFWFPDYIFQALSTFNWMTWIKPDNFNLAMVTGGVSGLGLNPWATFDWNMFSYSTPLAIPFFTQANQLIGMFIAFFIILGLYYSNYKWTAYLPINSNQIFANSGDTYDVQEILTNGLFDKSKYETYGPPYYTAGNLVVYGAFFAIYPFSIIYTTYTEWGSIRGALSPLKKLFSDTKSFSWKTLGSSNITSFNDPHSRMMAKYKEAPNWWFYIILLISLMFGIICVKAYPANTPVWGIFFTIAINYVFIIPLTIIYAVTGFSFGLNVLVELIIGYAIPGNGDALMTLKALGYNIGGQAENYISDQKMAHYAKIPPRAIFRGQLVATLLQVLVALLTINWEMSSVKDICTPDQPNKFSCPSENTFYAASVLWGVIGPKRVFNQLYPILQWCFLIGALLAVVCIVIKKKFKTYCKKFQPVVIIGGMLNFAPYNLTYYLPGFYFGYVFNHYIKKRYSAWWGKYNYILSSALDAGVAFSAIIIFFAVQYHEVDINWWGNNVMYEGVDGGAGQVSLKDPTTAPDGYFGLRVGQY